MDISNDVLKLIIKYIRYPSQYKLVSHDFSTIINNIIEKKVIKIQQFYRKNRTPRFNKINIQKISKNMLIRIYLTQYPIDDINDLLILFPFKLTYYEPYNPPDFLNLNCSPLSKLVQCLSFFSKNEIIYVGW